MISFIECYIDQNKLVASPHAEEWTTTNADFTSYHEKTWNRGILKSRGKYLVFLGVDETLTSNSLKVLSEYLDKNKDIDWVCGNTLVTSLDKNSYFLHTK